MEQSFSNEKLNILTHGIGTMLAVVAALILLNRVWDFGNIALVNACLMYGIALVGVFANSTLSHWVREPGRRHLFRQLDQAFIYLLIVATYTPLSVVYLRTRFWWILLATMWILAIAGFLSKLYFSHRIDSVSVLGYVALGWMPAIGGLGVFELVPAGAVWGIFAGGVIYKLGTIFLVMDKVDWLFHAIWIAAAGVHWWTTMAFVL